MALIRHNQVLAANLVTNATLPITGSYDQFRFAPNAPAVIVVDSAVYRSPTDFSLSVNGVGTMTLTWLNATTIVSGKTLQMAFAYQDFVTGDPVSAGGGSGGAVTSVDLGTKADASATSDTGTFSLIALTKRLLTYVGSSIAPSFTNLVSGMTTQMTGTTATAVTGMSAGGAGIFNYISSITVSNAHATVGTEVVLMDGATGAAFWTGPAAAAYGGVAITFNPPKKQPTANTALYAKNLTTGAAVTVSVNGYQGA